MRFIRAVVAKYYHSDSTSCCLFASKFLNIVYVAFSWRFAFFLLHFMTFQINRSENLRLLMPCWSFRIICINFLFIFCNQTNGKSNFYSLYTFEVEDVLGVYLQQCFFRCASRIVPSPVDPSTMSSTWSKYWSPRFATWAVNFDLSVVMRAAWNCASNMANHITVLWGRSGGTRSKLTYRVCAVRGVRFAPFLIPICHYEHSWFMVGCLCGPNTFTSFVQITSRSSIWGGAHVGCY